MDLKNIQISDDQNTSNREEIVKLFRGRCLINPGHSGIAVHEIIPRSQKPKTWNELSNQVLLCNDCHVRIHREGARNWVERLTKLRQDWVDRYG